MDAEEIEKLRKRIHYTKSKYAINFKSSFLTKIRESEANQLTVTRLAGSDQIFKQQVKIFQSDMSSTINDITRQQKRLRRYMKQYSKKLKQGKKERKKRDDTSKDIQESSDNFPLDIITEEQEVHSDTEKGDPEKHIHGNILGDENKETGEDVQVIVVGENTSPENTIVLSEENSKDIAVNSLTDTPMTTLTKNLQNRPNECNVLTKIDDSLMKDIEIKLYSKKKRQKRKPAVCYSDLVKLQHSTNRRQLLGLVDKLAKLHGISDNQVKSSKHIEKPPSSEPLRRNSLYYTINYGYDVPDDDEDEGVKHKLKGDERDEKVENDKDLSTEFRETAPPYNHIFSAEDNRFWREIHRERISRETLLSDQNGDSLLKSRGNLRREKQTMFPLIVADYATMDGKVPSASKNKQPKKHVPTSNKLDQSRYTYLPAITYVSK